MKTALRILSSLVIALIVALVLDKFSFDKFSKRIIRISGNRATVVRTVERTFSFEGVEKNDTYVFEAVFFENYRGSLTLHVSLNETRIVSFAPRKNVQRLDFAASSLQNGQNTLGISADSPWSFKTLRLKNIYGYSSGFPTVLVLNKKNEFRTPGSPQDASFYLIFLVLFFISVFTLTLGAGQKRSPLLQQAWTVRSLANIVLLLFLFVLIIPLIAKYRVLLGFRSVLYLTAIYLGLIHFKNIRNFVIKAPQKFLHFVAGWQELIAVFAISRLGIYGVGYLSSLVINKGPWFSTAMPSSFLRLFFNWDSFWHQEIAELGYYFIPGKPSNIAFFPLYPLVVQFSSFIVGGLRTNGFVISNLATLLAVFYLVKLVRLEYGDEKIAGRAALYLLIFPGSLFFSYFYSEGLFLFLSLAAFYHARRKQWLSASLFGFFAALTRIVGVLIVVPLLIEYFEPRLESWKIRLNRAKTDGFLLLLVPLGLLSFMTYCGFKFADPLAFIHAQAAWGTKPVTPAGILVKILTLPPFYRMIYVGLILFTLFVISVMILNKFRASHILYSGLLFITYLLTNAIESAPRQLNIVFPLFIGMALLGKNKLVHHVIVFVSVALLTLLTILSANGYWFV